LKDGVIVGADSRSTAGHLVANKNSMKLHRLTDSIYAAGAGTAADLMKVCGNLKWKILKMSKRLAVCPRPLNNIQTKSLDLLSFDNDSVYV